MKMVYKKMLKLIFFIFVGSTCGQPPHCKVDLDCESGSYCDDTSKLYRCKECVVCEQYNRHSIHKNICLTSVTDDCGECKAGYIQNEDDPLRCVLKSLVPDERSGDSGVGGGPSGLYWVIGGVLLGVAVFTVIVIVYFCSFRKKIQNKPNNEKEAMSSVEMNNMQPFNPSAPSDHPHLLLVGTANNPGMSHLPGYFVNNSYPSNQDNIPPPPYPQGEVNANNRVDRSTAASYDAARESQQDVAAKPFSCPSYVKPGICSQMLSASKTVTELELEPFMPVQQDQHSPIVVEPVEEIDTNWRSPSLAITNLNNNIILNVSVTPTLPGGRTIADTHQVMESRS